MIRSPMEEVTRRSQRGREQSLEEDPTKVGNTHVHLYTLAMVFGTVYLSYGLRLCNNALRISIKVLILIRYHLVRVKCTFIKKNTTKQNSREHVENNRLLCEN